MLRKLLRIHLNNPNPGPYVDIMNALVGAFTDPITHDARRRCFELWLILELQQEHMRRPPPTSMPGPGVPRGGG